MKIKHKDKTLEKPIVILIGGVPGVGKTTLAVKLAYKLGIKEVLDTDNVREVARYFSNESILHSVTHESWKFFGQKTDENIISGLQAHTKAIHPLIIKILNYNFKRKTSIIIEGVHITPDLLDQIDIPVFYFQLIVSDENEHLSRLKSKNCCGACWQKNFSAIRKMQDWLVSECYDTGIPIIESSTPELTIENISSHIQNVSRLRLYPRQAEQILHC